MSRNSMLMMERELCRRWNWNEGWSRVRARHCLTELMLVTGHLVEQDLSRLKAIIVISAMNKLLTACMERVLQTIRHAVQDMPIDQSTRSTNMLKGISKVRLMEDLRLCWVVTLRKSRVSVIVVLEGFEVTGK